MNWKDKARCSIARMLVRAGAWIACIGCPPVLKVVITMTKERQFKPLFETSHELHK